MSDETKRYLICTVPRSGSTYLCDLIARTGVLGMRPDEPRRFEYVLRYFRTDFRGVDRARTGVQDLLDAAFAESASPNGVGGFKVMWQHFDRVIDEGLRNGAERGLRRIDVERQIAASTRFVWLRRRNRVRQAISWTKALQSDGWHIESQRAYQGAYTYDFPGICLARWRIRRAETGWSEFFRRCDARPLVLYYEDCLSDLPGAIGSIARLLDVPAPEEVHDASSSLEVQADSVNDEWERRFRVDSAGAAASLGAVARALGSGAWWSGYRRRITLPGSPRRRVR